MEAKFDTVLGKIEKFAAAAGGVMHRRMAKIGMYLCFVTAILFFGFFIFSSSFFRSLFGTKPSDRTHI